MVLREESLTTSAVQHAFIHNPGFVPFFGAHRISIHEPSVQKRAFGVILAPGRCKMSTSNVRNDVFSQN